jgi:TatD DNase family protein
MFIDTHAHIYMKEYDLDIREVIDRAVSDQIDYIIVPAIDIQTSFLAADMAATYPMIYSAAGVHPHETSNWDEALIPIIEEIVKNNNKIVAIGEIGLDYHYDFSPRDQQLKAFRDQIELAIRLDKPIIVHNREADDDILNILTEYAGTGLRAQLHCYSGSIKDARKLISMHHFISFTGNITYKKADELKQVLAGIVPEHLLLETDSPYMSPEPFRGKRNEPSNVKIIAEKIAEVYRTSTEDIARVTSYNAFRLFGIGTRPDAKYTYMIGKTLYINVTNRCNANCVFCNRRKDPVIAGYNLFMNPSEEPPAEVYISEMGDPKNYNEVVFCGFGEPTIRWDVIKEVAEYVKQFGGRTRLNTNGHGNYINKRDITPEMKGLIDIVSVSLNSTDSVQYSKLMNVDPSLFEEMIHFTILAQQNVEKVRMSVVSVDEVEVENSRKFVEEVIGAEFRIRAFF